MDSLYQRMSSQPTTEVATTPLPFPSREERDALVLEFYRLAARLSRAAVVTQETASRFMRMINQERRAAEDRLFELSTLVLAILQAVERGTFKEEEHFVRRDGNQLAIHLESIAKPLFNFHDTNWDATQLRVLMKFGARHFSHVVRAHSDRAFFAYHRRRVIVLHEPSAYEFVGYRKKVVPLG